MSRKSLGKAGRTKTRSVKLTEYEIEYMIRRYGSVPGGLRAGVDKLLPNSVNHPTRAARPKRVTNSQDTLFPSQSTCGPNLSDHPGWTEIARGPKTKTVIKACRVCGVKVTEKE